ncbi:cell surface protein [Geodermatophilus sp. TF02-6]|uniref:Hsp70 family protein n=1 Tax=Geodermatophilus sp. TF02-6 TaxID=2250575 RepID=UPI000DE8E280|nr:Hsp70 family protein [Geodermatophilus sp. TF02-6]RBY82472.1 cell surface protein [Geodermatophilus sp. TF02-6]
MRYGLGIDLGTTFVAAAVERDGRAETLRLGDAATVVHAAVAVRDDGVLVSGDAAARRAVSDPDRVATDLKRRLGDPTPVVLGGTSHSVTELLGTLLGDVFVRAVEASGGEPDTVVLTHPANWGPLRCRAFADVAASAGLARYATVTEPEAAAAHHAATHRLGDDEVFAVYDLGGGTFDATVLRRTTEGIEVLGTPEGIEHLGGTDFDDAVLAHVDSATGGALRRLDLGDARTVVALARLRQDCTAAKEALSFDTETTIPVFLPGRHLEVRLTRAQLEDLIRLPVESTLGALSRTVRTAGVAPGELSAVVLVGGSSQIPLIAEMVSEQFGCPAVVDAHPKHAVALGAALGARSRAGTGGAARLPAPRRPAVAAVAPAAPARSAAPSPPAAAPSPAGPLPPPGADPGSAGGAPADGAPATTPALLAVVVLAVVALLRVLVLSGTGQDAPGGQDAGAGTATSAAASPGGAIPAPQVATSAPVPSAGPTIPVGPTPGYVAASPDGRRLYVTNRGAGVITVVDTATDQVTAAIPVEAGPPQYLTFSPDGTRAYVSVWDDARTVAAVCVLDTGTDAIVATVPVRSRPYVSAVTPDGSRLYVPNHDSGTVSVIDTATDTLVADVSVPPNPHWVELTPDGSRAYVADHESDVVSVIDTATATVVGEIPVGTSPHSVAVHRTRPLVANVNYDADSVTVIDTDTDEVVATVAVGEEPQDVTWSADGRFAYVTNVGDSTLSVISADDFRVTATVPTGGSPTSVTVLPDGSRGYVSDLDDGTLTVLDLAG